MYFTVKKVQVLINDINDSDIFIRLKGNKINVKNISEQLSEMTDTPFKTKRTKLFSRPTLDIFIEGVFIGFVSVSDGRLTFSTRSKYVEIYEREITSLTYERAIRRQTKHFNRYFLQINK